MDLTDKKVLVVGSGISGLGAVRLLSRIGAKPILFDSNPAVKPQDIHQKLPEELLTGIIIGQLPPAILRQLALVVVSPGVSLEKDFMQDIMAAHIPVWGEIELAYAYAQGQIIAITGTNGKTTTTTLVGKLLAAFFPSVYVVGNIGNPYTEIANETTDQSITVAEISSFQLETVGRFRPDIAVILNISPDHLDRHHTMECYVNMKKRVVDQQKADQLCILNYDNEYTRAIGAQAGSRVIYFSVTSKLAEGLWLDGDMICLSADGKTVPVMRTGDMKLVGLCNVENVMAAIAVAHAMGLPLELIAAQVAAFAPIAHRIEYVATKDGVDYYNDSKGTNPDAAIQGIKAMSKPTVLIGGGYQKDNQYDEWIQAFEQKVKAFVLIGETKLDIARCARKYGVHNIILADTFEEAFQICVEQAEAGDAVLLSPACASWGMFTDYQERGNRFKALVHSL